MSLQQLRTQNQTENKWKEQHDRQERRPDDSTDDVMHNIEAARENLPFHIRPAREHGIQSRYVGAGAEKEGGRHCKAVGAARRMWLVGGAGAGRMKIELGDQARLGSDQGALVPERLVQAILRVRLRR